MVELNVSLADTLIQMSLTRHAFWTNGGLVHLYPVVSFGFDGLGVNLQFAIDLVLVTKRTLQANHYFSMERSKIACR